MIFIPVISITMFLGVLTLFLYRDLKKWSAGIPVDHGGKTVIKRLPYQLPSAIGFAFFAGEGWGINWWGIPVAYLMMNFFWWEFFDGVYNIRRDKRWRYNGSFNDPGHTDAWTDKLLKRMKPWQQAVLKWGCIAASIFLYIKICR